MGFPKRRDFKIPPLHSEGKKMSPPKDLRALLVIERQLIVAG